MDVNNKQRREIRRRNYVAKELRDRRFQQQVVRDKRKHLIDEIHEHEAEEDLYDFFNLGKAPKE
jgi:hypothetical protein